MNTSRRDFLSYAFYSGAFVMLAPLPTLSAIQNPHKSEAEVSPMLKINEDNSMVFYYPSPEMGQGVDTSLTMLFMEELQEVLQEADATSNFVVELRLAVEAVSQAWQQYSNE